MNPEIEYEKKLEAAGISTKDLCVLHAGVDVIVGEVPDLKGQIVGRTLVVKNPRRFLTLRQQTPRGLSVNSMIGPLETIEGGFIEIIPHMGFKVEEASSETKELLYGLYCDFLGILAQNRAAEAGIVIPDGGPVKIPGSISSHMR